MTPDFNKSAFTLTPTQLGEWVYHELTRGKNSYDYDKQEQRYDHIRFLMAAGADPAWNSDMRSDGMTSTHKGYTLAMAAAYSCDAKALKILADFNVNLDTYDSHGMSPLDYVLRYNQDPMASKPATEAALFLISKNVSIRNLEDPEAGGSLPIVQAAGAGWTEVVEALIQAKADVNAKNSYGETALVGAVFKQKPDVVKVLLKAGADINWVSHHSGKPLIEHAEKFAPKSAAAAEVLQILKDFAAKQNPPAPKGPGPKI